MVQADQCSFRAFTTSLFQRKSSCNMRCNLLLLALCAAQSVSAELQTPQFDCSRATKKLLLNWDEVWEVGDSGALAVLRARATIAVWLRVTGDTGVGLRRLLSFQCPRANGSDTIDLDSVGPAATAVMRCPDTLPFVIAKADDGSVDKFRLHIGESSIAGSQVFKEALELRVRVEFSTGRLESGPLRIWNLDPLSPAASISAVAADFNAGFLTKAAVSFATSISSYSDSFASIDFLEPGVVKALTEAPQFFRAKLNLGMILYFDSSSCLTYQLSSSILLVNYHSKMDIEHKNFAKLVHLNLKDGKLWFSTCGLSREVKSFYEKQKPAFSIGICTITSVTGDAEPYVNTGPVRLRILLNELSYQGCNSTSASRSCEVVPNVNAKVTVVSGMDNTAIVCPIVCHDKSEVYRFYRDGKPLIGSPTEDWSLVDGIRVAKTGNIVEFPPYVSAAHSGTYRCEAGSKQFSFDVTVVSLPHFTIPVSSSAAQYGLLPERVFAIEGESLTYNCTVNFAGLSSVRVSPVFHIATTAAGKLSWMHLNDEGFRQKVDATKESLSLVATETQASRTLTVTVARVPPVNPSTLTNFSHRFECSASVGSAESQLVGMAEYVVQSPRSEVVFVPRLTMDSFVLNPSNNCSVQRCLIGKGAFFEFSLTRDTLNRLRGIGVEVIAYLTLDGVPLSEASVLLSENASALEVDSASGRLAFRIHPVSSHEVLTVLVRSRSLTPVFTLRYGAGASLGSLRMLKAAYGEPSAALRQLDCRADPLCFYSTDFDADGALSLLTVALTFEPPPDPSPQLAGASAFLAGIIAAAVLLIIALAVIVYLATRRSERTYQVAEMELQKGYNPQLEARAEVFAEYQRPSHLEGIWEPEPVGDQLSLISGLSGANDDETNPDDIDYKEFGEEGSFIGNYNTDPRKRDLLNAPGANGVHL